MQARVHAYTFIWAHHPVCGVVCTTVVAVRQHVHTLADRHTPGYLRKGNKDLKNAESVDLRKLVLGTFPCHVFFLQQHASRTNITTQIYLIYLSAAGTDGGLASNAEALSFSFDERRSSLPRRTRVIRGPSTDNSCIDGRPWSGPTLHGCPIRCGSGARCAPRTSTFSAGGTTAAAVARCTAMTAPQSTRSSSSGSARTARRTRCTASTA